MIDINLIRENPELVKENIKKRFQENKLCLVNEVLELDKEWRKLKYRGDKLRGERNTISKKINELKNKGKSFSEELKKAKEIPKKIKINRSEEHTSELQSH